MNAADLGRRQESESRSLVPEGGVDRALVGEIQRVVDAGDEMVAALPLQAAENRSAHRPAAPGDEDAVGAFHKVNFVVAGSWRYQASARLLALVNNRFAVLKKNLGLRRSGVMP